MVDKGACNPSHTPEFRLWRSSDVDVNFGDVVLFDPLNWLRCVCVCVCDNCCLCERHEDVWEVEIKVSGELQAPATSPPERQSLVTL
jgi:hypothetical protein